MRKPDRKPTAVELVALVVALVIGFAVAVYFGNLVWGIAVVTAVAILGFGFFYRAGSNL
ncbi:MAG TPA: hypothetical protein VIW24_06435 [Aldersonia sp.]